MLALIFLLMLVLSSLLFFVLILDLWGGAVACSSAIPAVFFYVLFFIFFDNSDFYMLFCFKYAVAIAGSLFTFMFAVSIQTEDLFTNLKDALFLCILFIFLYLLSSVTTPYFNVYLKGTSSGFKLFFFFFVPPGVFLIFSPLFFYYFSVIKEKNRKKKEILISAEGAAAVLSIVTKEYTDRQDLLQKELDSLVLKEKSIFFIEIGPYSGYYFGDGRDFSWEHAKLLGYNLKKRVIVYTFIGDNEIQVDIDYDTFLAKKLRTAPKDTWKSFEKDFQEIRVDVIAKCLMTLGREGIEGVSMKKLVDTIDLVFGFKD